MPEIHHFVLTHTHDHGIDSRIFASNRNDAAALIDANPDLASALYRDLKLDVDESDGVNIAPLHMPDTIPYFGLMS